MIELNVIGNINFIILTFYELKIYNQFKDSQIKLKKIVGAGLMSRKKRTMDGNSAAAYVSYAFTEVAAIYPITPSSVMADEVDKFSSEGKKNLLGDIVEVKEMQSEAGAAGAMHGALAAGALTTTYTASQGLLLMIPNMYKIAGELLPCVIHVSARTLATHALSIFGDHSDIYACRQTGFAMLCSNNPQEVMDLSAVSHLSSIKGRIPFLHFFDGFRTSHEIQKVETWDYAELGEMLDWHALDDFRKNSLNPERPVLRGTAQNDDIYFQAREACNRFYDEIPNIVLDYMDEVNSRTGRDYKPFNYYGAPDAERVIIAMGSVCDTIEETINYLISKGEKVGLVKVRLYRPFVPKFLADVLPKTVRKISVLDRTKEPGSVGEPLYLDVLAALSEFCPTGISVYSGRYGLSSKDTTPGQITAVYRNMDIDNPKKKFTIGIEDDITYLSLESDKNLDTSPVDMISCKFWGLGSDGTIGANKNSIKIIGDTTDLYVQGYFAYDSKKSGGVTISHLRFGKAPIKSSYYVNRADFIACHNPSYIDKYEMVQDLKHGGSFLLNCQWSDNELSEKLPFNMKKFIADNKIRLFIIDGIKIGREIGLGGRINTALQAAFFKITNIIDIQKAVNLMKNAATNAYGHKGEKIVQMNHDAIDRGIKDVHEVKIPESWKNLEEKSQISEDTKENTQNIKNNESNAELKKYVEKILHPVNSRQGNELPVSSFIDYVDGSVPLGSSSYEKRGIAIDVPEWKSENCIQCNFCSYVCPHAVIRPAVMNEEETKNAPDGMKYKSMVGMNNLNFAITVSALDCTGCGNCAQVCPGFKGNKALEMKPFNSQLESQKGFNYAQKLSDKPEINEKFKETTVKGSQFKKPLLEFSGACAGCGETSYAKLATQLFGDRMYIANATGCSSIWGASAPSVPYTFEKNGNGPAWQNSLFEDNAEFGYGMFIAQNHIRNSLIEIVKALKDKTFDENLKNLCESYLESINDGKKNKEVSNNLIKELEKMCNLGDEISDLAVKILENREYLSKKSIWMFGGDGWAYDIGFGGLDHVIASGEDVNILVFDTECYSNTGGQASKATQIGAVAEFASKGKSTKKKDLATMAMTYGEVYVAQVAMGADYNQCIKAFCEAESFQGPSLIIAYSPCVNHGIKTGMGFSKNEEKNAVKSGYWNLFRFDPRRIQNKENPFVLDSKKAPENYQDFLNNEIRYTSLVKKFPQRAHYLFNKAERFSQEKYSTLVKHSENHND